MKASVQTIIGLVLVFSLGQVQAQDIDRPDTIRVGHKFKNFQDLEMGVTKDIIYTKAMGKIMSVTINIKETKTIEVDGQKLLYFSHNIQGPKPDFNGSFEYICEYETLKPIQLISDSPRAGKEGFKFSESLITSLDTVTDNNRKDFALVLDQPTFNWQIDLETYSLLPMEEGYHAVMNFYHPGSQTEPKFYHLKVIGSDMVLLPDSRSMDCWIVYTDYGGTQPTRFWYTKKGQNFVKMEGKYKQLTILKERIY
ncbi:hypothetical protein [Roseivirga sp. E12]|uniref:hypothetical protein n=1 Tax=Roseivirga sp. E12 TaxID=2819237 RepID=UPI001ABCB4ED|nr:hypothetical protein [Roseivirga sp. E12]MBO3699577.1 hypothetical protein [Roseivirga sp. E12]